MRNFLTILSQAILVNLIFGFAIRGSESAFRYQAKMRSSSDNSDIYTTHSESTRPIHVPVYEKTPVYVPHPVPIAASILNNSLFTLESFNR